MIYSTAVSWLRLAFNVYGIASDYVGNAPRTPYGSFLIQSSSLVVTGSARSQGNNTTTTRLPQFAYQQDIHAAEAAGALAQQEPQRCGSSDSQCAHHSMSSVTGRPPLNFTGRTRSISTGRPHSNSSVRPPSHAVAFLKDVCLLWDDSCLGKRISALDRFFNTTNTTEIINNVPSFNDTSLNNTVTNWMRSPQCMSSSREWLASNGQQTDVVTTQLGDMNCCHACNMYGGNVEVYYWPERNANSACLSIVGKTTNPPLFGATTNPPDPSTTYWGCEDPSISRGYLTTAIVTTLEGGVKYKMSLYDTWSPPYFCPETISNGSVMISDSIQRRQLRAQSHGRDSILVGPTNITRNDSPSVSTVVSRDFTL